MELKACNEASLGDSEKLYKKLYKKSKNRMQKLSAQRKLKKKTFLHHKNFSSKSHLFIWKKFSLKLLNLSNPLSDRQIELLVSRSNFSATFGHSSIVSASRYIFEAFHF